MVPVHPEKPGNILTNFMHCKVGGVGSITLLALKRCTSSLSMTFEKGFPTQKMLSIDLCSSNCSAVSVRWAAEVLPAGHTSHSGRRPPPHEGISLKSLQLSCGTQQGFTSHTFLFLRLLCWTFSQTPRSLPSCPTLFTSSVGYVLFVTDRGGSNFTQWMNAFSHLCRWNRLVTTWNSSTGFSTWSKASSGTLTSTWAPTYAA